MTCKLKRELNSYCKEYRSSQSSQQPRNLLFYIKQHLNKQLNYQKFIKSSLPQQKNNKKKRSKVKQHSRKQTFGKQCYHLMNTRNKSIIQILISSIAGLIFQTCLQTYNIEYSTMHISSTKYKLAELKYQHLPQVSKFLAQAFVRQNRIWSNIKFDENEAERFMYDKTKELLEWQQEQRDNGVLGKDTYLNFIYLDQKNQIIAALTGCEMMQYLAKKSNVSYQKFNILQSYGQKLKQFIKPQDKVSGLTFYGVFVGVNKDYFGTGVTMLFFYDAFHYMHSQGLRTFYGRASHVKTIALASGYGQHLGKFRFQEIKSEELYLVLVRLYMDPQHYIPREIKYFLSKSKL